MITERKNTEYRDSKLSEDTKPTMSKESLINQKNLRKERKSSPIMKILKGIKRK